MDSEEQMDRISRRKMLKRIGAGAAVVWSTPIITSIQTPAFAASGPLCSRCIPYDCVNPMPLCNNGTQCVCVTRINGECFCMGAVTFNGAGPPICANDADCQFIPGGVCVQMNPDCNAIGNVGCASPCTGTEHTRPGMKVRRAR
jgi:hypothetical protein